jgi:hypothetical protein
MNARRTAALAATLLLSACGGGAVGYSAPVGISLDAKSGDVVSGQVEVDKNVNTENGNPYGAFTNAAVQKLGRVPGRIAVTSATLTLEPSSTGVSGLQQVLAGPAVVSFQMNGSGNTFPVATLPSPTGTGPQPMSVSFDSASMSPADFADLVGGSFKVVLASPAAAGFAAASATANMQVTFGFAAYE